MYKIAILTEDIKQDIHSAELFEQASERAQAFILHPKDLQLEVNLSTPVIKSSNSSIYDLDAIIVRHLDQGLDTDLQFDLLSQLQQAGVLLINRCQALQITESKALTYYLLSVYGFPIIESLITQNEEKAIEFTSQYDDVVLKPLYGHLGQDMSRASEVDNYKQEIRRLIDGYGSVFVQRFVQSKGKDVRAFVIDDHVTAAIERQSTTGWKSNISQGGKAKKITLEKDLRNMAVKATQIIGLDYCGLDMISENGSTYILELNGSPAWMGVEQATGKNIAEELISMIIRKLNDRRKSNQFI